MKSISLLDSKARSAVNLVDGANYDGDGEYVVALTRGTRYRYVKSSNDTDISVAGGVTLTASGFFTVPAGSGDTANVTLTGSASSPVTALVQDTTELRRVFHTDGDTKAGVFSINVTAPVDAAIADIVPKIYGHDALTGARYLILEGAAITATGLSVLRVSPGIDAVANERANDILPASFEVEMEHSAEDTVTYQVTASIHQ